MLRGFAGQLPPEASSVFLAGWGCETLNLAILAITSSANMLSLAALKLSLNSTSKPNFDTVDQWDDQGGGSTLWDHLTIIFKQ